MLPSFKTLYTYQKSPDSLLMFSVISEGNFLTAIIHNIILQMTKKNFSLQALIKKH